MKVNKLIVLLLIFVVTLSLTSCSDEEVGIDNIKDYVNDKEGGNAQFDFPGNYIAPELRIDGQMKEEEWVNASEKIYFGTNNAASVVIYRGERGLFCFFDVKDPDIQTVGNNNGDDVTKGDSVEIYFDFKNNATKKPADDDIQINIGAHGKTRIFVGANGEWGSWNGLLDYQIEIDGTINDNKDVDNGYTVELMIPYSEIGIDKDSVFGVAVGHVARGTDSISEVLPYTWNGITYEGNFIDPQQPQVYLLLVGKKFYTRGTEPAGPVDVVGKVKDFDGNPVANATVKVANQTVTTKADGSYEVVKVDSEIIDTIEISKEGYLPYSYKIPKASLRNELGRVDLDFCLLEEGKMKTITLTGTVENPVYGLMTDVVVSGGNNQTITNSKGEFELSVEVTYDIAITLTKLGYKESVTRINVADLVGKQTHNLGVVSLSSPSSTTSFAGTKGIQLVNVEIFRGYEGIYFIFKTSGNVTNGSKIELFIDTAHSFGGRDHSDYRIDLDSDGAIHIENYGSGTNNIVSQSGIKNNSYLSGTTYYMEVLVPYKFLGIEQNDVIGVSFGLFDSQVNDWDGWGFQDTYIAPEYSDHYCRLGADNVLYKAASNTQIVNRVSGVILDQNNNPVIDATVNGVSVNSDGTFIIVVKDGDTTLNVVANGYIAQSVVISSSEFVDGIAISQIILTKAIATISGTCNVEGAKITLESDPTIYTYVVNGEYRLNVPTTGNAKLIIEASGYDTQIVNIGKNSLVQSAAKEIPVVKNITMEAN